MIYDVRSFISSLRPSRGSALGLGGELCLFLESLPDILPRISNTSWRTFSVELTSSVLAKCVDVFYALGRDMLSSRRFGRWRSAIFPPLLYLVKLETLWAGTLKPVFAVTLSIIIFNYSIY